ncbi:unnamed protein product [Adineta ricciae]|uniref:Major facilitator superfamily associated domain-containing protein n=1 Tax=Adineta ricciae TaxID=249248 RepID=A0A814NPH0_ADIRI|nr:unnamed protein product [Adineta ricciae]
MKTDATSPPNADVVHPHSSLPYIHRFYLLLKGHYFLHFSAFGIIYPILNITLRARGLSNVEISYFNIGIPFLVFVTNPLLNYVADLTRRYKLMFNCVFAIAAIACVVIFILPPVKSHHIQADLIDDHELGHVLEFCASQEVGTKCASRTECGCSYQANCTIVDTVYQRNPNEMKTFFFTFSMGLKNTSKEFKDDSRSCGLQYRVPVYQRFDASNFVPYQSPRLAVCEITCSIAHYCHGPRYHDQTRFVILYSLFFVLAANLLTNAIPLGVAIGFSSLHRSDIFGKQRVWGTIGFGISAFLASRLYEAFHSEYVYVIFFMIMAAICMVITSFVRIQPDKRKRHATVEEVLGEDDGQVKKKKKKSQSPLFELIPLVKRIDVIVFLLLLFVWGMSYGVLDPYLYLYIDEFAPCQSRSIVGYMSLISAIAEVIALFFAEKVLKFLGTDVASIIILLAFALRFAGYYFILQPFLLPISETMHFFNFGILYVLVLQKAASIAPAGLVGTLQSLSLGINFGLARGIGLIASSFIYTLLEQRLLFLVFAIFNVICAIIFGLYFLVTRKRSNGQTDLSKPPVDAHVNANEEPLLTTTTA